LGNTFPPGCRHRIADRDLNGVMGGEERDRTAYLNRSQRRSGSRPAGRAAGEKRKEQTTGITNMKKTEP